MKLNPDFARAHLEYHDLLRLHRLRRNTKSKHQHFVIAQPQSGLS